MRERSVLTGRIGLEDLPLSMFCVRILSPLFLAASVSFLCSPAALAEDNRWPTTGQIGPALVRAEFKLDDRTLNALAHMSSTRDELGKYLELTIPETPIELYLFRSRWSFDRYIKERIPEGRGRAALFVKTGGTGRVYAYYSGNLAVDLRHESTHAFLHGALPYVPLWLDEGLAEYFEVPPTSRYQGHEHLKSLKRSLWFRWTPRIDRLEALATLSDMREDEYREAWAWVHFMLHGPPAARQVLRTYLGEIADQKYAGPLAPRLRSAVPNLEQALKTHLKSIR